MTVYIDEQCKCHVEAAEGLRAVETEFFDGKCRRFIEGYRFVPAGETWLRSDGVEFKGEMIAPHEDYRILAVAQAQYEEMLAELSATQEELVDADAALNELGVEF